MIVTSKMCRTTVEHCTLMTTVLSYMSFLYSCVKSNQIMHPTGCPKKKDTVTA